MNWRLATLYALGLLTGLGLLWLVGWTWLGEARAVGPVTKVASLALLVGFLTWWTIAWRRA